MGITIERDIGDGVAVSGKPAMFGQMCLHDYERGIPRGMPFGYQMEFRRQGFLRFEAEPAARNGDIGLMLILLEEHPLQSLCPSPCVRWHEGRVLREVEQNGARF